MHLCDVLTIKSISADGVDFEFEYQKTGRGVVFSPEKATFVEPYHAIARVEHIVMVEWK